MDDYITFQEFEILEFLIFLEKSRPKFFKLAACTKENLDTFFPNQGQSSLMKKAIEVCFTCAVQKDCHEYALKEKIEHGVWGGSSADVRRVWIRENISADVAWGKLTEFRLEQ